MNPRQEYALAHPLERADNLGVFPAYREQRRHGTGLLLSTILAVDR